MALVVVPLALVVTAVVWTSLRTPIVRQIVLPMPDWPQGQPELRIAFLSDIHVAGPDMPPSRLVALVQRINALRPDLVLIAGDFVSDKRTATKLYAAEVALLPLAALDARYGTVAVLGNHDHWRGTESVKRALRTANVRLLENSALKIGPLALGGIDDDYTGHADVTATSAAMQGTSGSKVMLSHSPDVVSDVPNDVTLLLAGHTHCGQIVLPIIGALAYMSRYGDRYACGVAHNRSLRVITTAGIGTSILPIRLGAPPEVLLLTLRASPISAR